MPLRSLAAPAILLALTGSALAHTGHGAASGFTHGFTHPLGGLDHVLAMVAVGLYAAMIGRRALWLIPATFIGAMALGGAAGVAGLPLPHGEIGIALSVVALGLAIAFRVSLPAVAAAAVIGLFAIFHGHAHGTEMPQAVSGTAYAAGFVLATALLHCVGIALGLLVGRSGERRAGWRCAQAAGGGIAIAGALILAGVA